LFKRHLLDNVANIGFIPIFKAYSYILLSKYVSNIGKFPMNVAEFDKIMNPDRFKELVNKKTVYSAEREGQK